MMAAKVLRQVLRTGFHILLNCLSPAIQLKAYFERTSCFFGGNVMIFICVRSEVKVIASHWALPEGGPNSTHFMSMGSLRSLHGHWAGMKSEWEHMVPTCCWQRPRFIWMSNYLKNENKLLGQNGSVLLISDASPVPCLLKLYVSQKKGAYVSWPPCTLESYENPMHIVHWAEDNDDTCQPYFDHRSS